MAAVVAGCSSSNHTRTTDVAAQKKVEAAGEVPASATATTPPAPRARVSITPSGGSGAVSPLSAIVVKATAGTLSSVTVRSSSGALVAGAMSADHTSWTSTEVLGYSKTYAVAAVAKNADGVATKLAKQLATVTPATLTLPYLFPTGSVRTVGIGQPITVRFDESIADKAAAQRALSVKTSPTTQGSWYWLSDREVHWRPRVYWRPGTTVKVTAKVYGVNVGNNIYGQQDVTSSFKIGPSRIATIDDRTHMMVVRISGKVVRHIPVSMGRGGSKTVNGKTIYFSTQSGPHVVQEKYLVKRMTSASYGLPKTDPMGYDEDIKLAVRISGDGEFIHSAPWSVWAQGSRNTSHGCVNVSPSNAQWFYDTFSYGDVVDIENTGVTLPLGTKYGDWTLSWTAWQKGSALG